MSEPREKPPASIWRDGRGAFALVFRSPLSLFLIVYLSFVAAFLSLSKTGLQGLAYLHPSRAPFWFMLMTLAPTAWVTSIFLLFGDFARYRSAWPRTRRGRMAVALCAIISMLLSALPHVAQFLIWKESPSLLTPLVSRDPDFLLNMSVMTLLGLLAAALHSSAMVGVHIQLLGRLPKYQHLAEAIGEESLDEDVRWYRHRHADLQWFLRILAAFLGITVLGLNALRNILNTFIASPTEQLPITSLMSYGLYLTGLLASFYVPAHRTLSKVGEALVERLVWQSLGANPTWKHRLEEQQSLRIQLGLQGSALQDLQQGIAVLAPFLASISSLVFDLGG